MKLLVLTLLGILLIIIGLSAPNGILGSVLGSITFPGAMNSTG
jgi:hypothetical protein